MGIFDWIGGKIAAAPKPIRKVIEAGLDSALLLSKTTSKVLNPIVTVASGIVAGVVTKSPAVGIGASLAVGGTLGALASSGVTKTTERAVQGVSSVTNFAGNVGELIVEPSWKKAKDVVVENPIVSTLVGVGALAGTGIAGAIVAKEVFSKEKVNASPEDTTANYAVLPTTSPTPISTNEGKPITPETTTISTDKKRRKRSTKKVSPQIRINNVIGIKNSSTGVRIANKRYIKELAY